MGIRTPWGTSDHEKQHAPGITFYGTPSHGGFKLDRERNARVNAAWRKPGGWYEEDVHWAIVAYTFPQHFSDDEFDAARAALMNYYPDAFMAVAGITLTLDESRVLRERAFRKEHAQDYITVAAWGDWHPQVPDGMVTVMAVRGGRDEQGRYATSDHAYFQVPEEEYSGRQTLLGFVVSVDRHPMVESIV